MLKDFDPKVITVDCVKKHRPNHFAPAVVAHQKQVEVQWDWVIASIKIKDLDILDWCAMFDLDAADWKRTLEYHEPFKTKKAALASVVEHFTQWIAFTDPEDYWFRQYTEDEEAMCQKILESLQ
jgi:hypothetical protein